MLPNEQKFLSKLPCPIKQSVCIGSLTVVLVDDDKQHGRGDKTLNRNVYAFDENGCLMWQIQEAPDGGNERPKPYKSLRLTEGKVYVYNWIGTDYWLDLSDGSVHFYGSPRRPW